MVYTFFFILPVSYLSQANTVICDQDGGCQQRDFEDLRHQLARLAKRVPTAIILVIGDLTAFLLTPLSTW
jgi:hypothetical protein